MSDISQVITQIHTHIAAPIVVTLIALLALAHVNRHRLRLAWLNLKTRFCLDRLGLEQISGIQCPDGLGHEFVVDRLLLRHDGITLLITKQYPGKIFCSEHIDDWTQMLGSKSFRFQNPLYELDIQVQAISKCLPGIAVDGYLFFDYLAEFPKGHPERVIHPASIPAAIRKNNRHQVDMTVMQAWKSLKQMAQQG
jgi:hypothetical protein